MFYQSKMNKPNSGNINFEESNKGLYIIVIIAVLLAFIGTILNYFFHVPFGECLHNIASPIFIVCQGIIIYRYYKFKNRKKIKKTI